MAAEVGISRKCLSKWYGRWQMFGEQGLLDQSSRPDGVLDWTTASTWRGYDGDDVLAVSFWNVSGRIVSTGALVSGEPDDVCGGAYFVSSGSTFFANYSSACDWIVEG